MGRLGYAGRSLLYHLIVSVSFLGLVLAAGTFIASGSEDRHDTDPVPIENWTFRPPETISPLASGPDDIDMEDTGMAVGPDGSIHTIWMEAGTRVVYSVRPSGSSGFTQPVMMNDKGLFVERPQIDVGPDGTVHVVWVERENEYDGGNDSDASRLVWSFSGNNGSTWSALNRSFRASTYDTLPSRYRPRGNSWSSSGRSIEQRVPQTQPTPQDTWACTYHGPMLTVGPSTRSPDVYTRTQALLPSSL